MQTRDECGQKMPENAKLILNHLTAAPGFIIKNIYVLPGVPEIMQKMFVNLLQNIEKPDDELMFALLLKNFSDRQILIDKKLINYIIKRIDRSYGKIFNFIYKIDEISLKKKKPIDFKTIKEVLGE